MILSDKDIKRAVVAGKISIDPFEESAVQPASVDVRLGSEFLIFKWAEHICIDVKEPVDELMERVSITDERPFILHPDEFALGVTYEEIGVSDDMVGRLEGKSSLGRLGIIIHATAGYLDPGNKLHMTLELHNLGRLPVKLYYKMPIAQMSFTPLTSPAERPYGSGGLKSKYSGDRVPRASMYYKNFERQE